MCSPLAPAWHSSTTRRGGATSGAVAYVVKGWPRRSELFIASEIHRLERLGVAIRLYVSKPADERDRHTIVDEIRTSPVYLPATTSLSAEPYWSWLRSNAPKFTGALARVARRHPVGLLRAARDAAAQSFRARKGWIPRKIYTKELLLAIALADEIDRAGDVRHLHAHFAHGATTMTWIAATICAKPFSVTGHAKDIYRESLNPAGLLARKLRAAEFACTCTGANVEYLRAVEPGAAIHLVYHGLNAEFSELLARAPARATPARTRIVSVGRYVSKKGFDVLLDAVADVRERGRDVELVLIGESGDQDARIRDRIVALGLGDVVEMRGPASQAELLAEYRRSSLFALACRIDDDGDRDGIPNVLVEAMAAGLPVVSTAVSGIPELVCSGENGLLVAPESPPALADAILRIAEDELLAARLARAAAKTVSEHFDGDVLARRLVDLFALGPARGEHPGRRSAAVLRDPVLGTSAR
jgi:glycosyltransferase involved in cell wall biosynthesis